MRGVNAFENGYVEFCVYCKKRRTGFYHIIENNGERIQKAVIKWVCQNFQEDCLYAINIQETYEDTLCNEIHYHVPIDKNLTKTYPVL